MQNDFQAVNASVVAAFEKKAKADSPHYTEIEGELPSRLSMRAYEWIRENRFAKVDFGDSPHLAYYCLMGKILGLEEDEVEYRFQPFRGVENIEDRIEPVRETVERVWLTRQVQELLLPLANNPARRSNRPSLSVVVAHRNRSHFVRDLLHAFAHQSDPDFELVLADDASDIETVNELKVLQTRSYPFRLKIAHSPSHLGARGIRNFGVRQAIGDVIVFYDDDNLPLKSSVSLLRDAWSSCPFDILVSPFWRVFDRADAHRLFNGPPRRNERYWLPLGGAREIARMQNVLGDMNFSIRRQTFQRIGGLNERSCLTCEDWEFLSTALRMRLAIGVLPRPTQIYFDQAGSFFKRLPRSLSEVAAIAGLPEEIHRIERNKAMVLRDGGDPLKAQTLFSGQVPSQKGPHRLRFRTLRGGQIGGKSGDKFGDKFDNNSEGPRKVKMKLSSGSRARLGLAHVSLTGGRVETCLEVIKGEGIYEISGDEPLAEIELEFPRGLFSIDWITMC